MLTIIATGSSSCTESATGSSDGKLLDAESKMPDEPATAVPTDPAENNAKGKSEPAG